MRVGPVRCEETSVQLTLGIRDLEVRHGCWKYYGG